MKKPSKLPKHEAKKVDTKKVELHDDQLRTVTGGGDGRSYVTGY